MTKDDKVSYITDEDAPNWRVRIHMMNNIDFIYVTLQSASIRGGDANGTTWLDSFNHYKKFHGDQMFEAMCYAYALLKSKGQPTMEQSDDPLQKYP